MSPPNDSSAINLGARALEDATAAASIVDSEVNGAQITASQPAALPSILDPSQHTEIRQSLFLELDFLRRAQERIPIVIEQINALSPWWRLQHEVIIIIFELSLTLTNMPRYDQLDVLRLVCREWNSIALDTPRLWAHIDDSGWDRGGLLVPRSRAVPLTVRLTWLDSDTSIPEKSEHFFWLFAFGNPVNIAARLQNISLVLFGDRDLPVNDMLSALEFGTMPLLEKFEVRTRHLRFQPFILRDFNRGSPGLRFVSLENINWQPPWVAANGLTVEKSISRSNTSLQELRLRCTIPTGPRFHPGPHVIHCFEQLQVLLDMLTGFKNLRILHIIGAGIGSDVSDASKSQITLPELQDLTIEQFDSSSPFWHLPMLLDVPHPYRICYGLPSVVEAFDLLKSLVPLDLLRPTELSFQDDEAEISLSLFMDPHNGDYHGGTIRSLTVFQRPKFLDDVDPSARTPSYGAPDLFVSIFRTFTTGRQTIKLRQLNFHGIAVDHFSRALLGETETLDSAYLPHLECIEVWGMPDSEASIIQLSTAIKTRCARARATQVHPISKITFGKVSSLGRVMLREEGELMRELRVLVPEVKVLDY